MASSRNINVDKLMTDGYAIMEDFATGEEVEEMVQGCWNVVDQADLDEERATFTTGDKQTTSKYFMESGDKVRLFYEEGSVSESGDIIIPKRHLFNKIGHALHMLNAPFRNFTFSEKVQTVMRDIGYVDPIAFQSTIIMKPPRIGAVVYPHQDMTYLYVDSGKLIALWLALEDADIDNGCLEFIPGSHKEGVHGGRRYVKDLDDPNGVTTKLTAPTQEYDDSLFIPVPVKKGGMIVFDGCVVHRSAANTSDRSRLAYAVHAYDAHNSVYSDLNWLQPTKAGTFANMYATSREMPAPV